MQGNYRYFIPIGVAVLQISRSKDQNKVEMSRNQAFVVPSSAR